MLNATVDVGYGGSLVATFENQIIAGAMSSAGDSGSSGDPVFLKQFRKRGGGACLRADR